MRFLLVLLLTALATYVALLAMPWWTALPISFILLLLIPIRKNWKAFLAAGLGVALCWFILVVMADQANDHILSKRMAVLFQLPSYLLMLIVTTLVGFLTGGLGGWTATALRHLFRAPKEPTKS